MMTSWPPDRPSRDGWSNLDHAPCPAIDVLVESPLWEAMPLADAVVRRAIAAAAVTDRQNEAGAVAVLLCDDAAIAALNAQWRGLDRPTNVLSFPAPRPERNTESKEPRPSSVSCVRPVEPVPLGDIAIAYETVVREAEAGDMPVADHLAHLAVHGFLHLLGYDHQDDGEASRMEGLERDILARIGIADPYADDAV